VWKRSKDRQPELWPAASPNAAEQLGVHGKATLQPPVHLCQSTTGLTQLSFQDTSFVPSLLCYKADMLRGWIMVIQIYNLEFKENAGGAVEYLKYPKTGGCEPFAVRLSRVWSCCVRYPAVPPPCMLFSCSHCNRSFPKGSLSVHTFGVQCLKQLELFFPPNTSLFWPVRLVSW